MGGVTPDLPLPHQITTQENMLRPFIHHMSSPSLSINVTTASFLASTVATSRFCAWPILQYSATDFRRPSYPIEQPTPASVIPIV